jgi:hypothetical protein
VSDEGLATTSVLNVPILNQAYTAPTLMSVAYHPTGPNVPVPDVQTSYVSLMVASLDPNYTAKLTEAQHEATALATTAVQFYAMGPWLAMPTTPTAVAQLAQLDAMLMQAEANLAAAEAAGAETSGMIVQLLKLRIMELEEWIALLAQ